MKVTHSRAENHAAVRASTKPFKILLAGSRAAKLVQARAKHHAEAQRLLKARAQGLSTNEARLEQRLFELLRQSSPLPVRPAQAPQLRAISDGPSTELPAPTVLAVEAKSPAQLHQATPSAPVAAATQALALVERMEAWMQQGRPTLTLALLDERLKGLRVERIGKHELAVHLTAHVGAETTELLALLPAALGSRGLKLSQLRVEEALS